MREGSWHDLGSLLGGAGYTNCYTPSQYEDKDSQSHGNHQTDTAVTAIINSVWINSCVRDFKWLFEESIIKKNNNTSTEPLIKVQNEVQMFIMFTFKQYRSLSHILNSHYKLWLYHKRFITWHAVCLNTIVQRQYQHYVISCVRSCNQKSRVVRREEEYVQHRLTGGDKCCSFHL